MTASYISYDWEYVMIDLWFAYHTLTRLSIRLKCLMSLMISSLRLIEVSNFISNFNAGLLKKFWSNYRKTVPGSGNPKSKRLYNETDRLVENISRIIQFAILYASPVGFVLPKGLLSFSLYFTTDLENDAFDLSLPLLWDFYIKLLW